MDKREQTKYVLSGLFNHFLNTEQCIKPSLTKLKATKSLARWKKSAKPSSAYRTAWLFNLALAFTC